jgi:transcriptional regulator with XRE-family HTH domain
MKYNPYNLSISGGLIRRHRIDCNLKLKDLANLLNVSSSFLSAVEKGIKIMPAKHLNKVYKFLKLDNKKSVELNKQIISDLTIRFLEKMC